MRVEIEKRWGCCRQSNVGPMGTKLISLKGSRQETSPSLHPVQEGREAFGFGIGNIYEKNE